MSCKFKDTNRTGLYIMVFLILMNSCDSDSSRIGALGRQIDDLQEQLERIEMRLTREER